MAAKRKMTGMVTSPPGTFFEDWQWDTGMSVKDITELQGANVVPFPVRQNHSGWRADLGQHGILLAELDRIAKLHALVQRHVGAKTDTAALDGIRSLPTGMRTRLALRMAVAKMRNTVGDALTPTKMLLAEHRFLADALAAKQAEIEAIEGRILTMQPTSPADTQVLLRFIAQLVTLGRPIDARYLADMLEGCAVGLNALASAQRPGETDIKA